MFFQPFVGAPSQPAIVQVTIQRIIFNRQEASRMGPIFKQRAFSQQIVQPAWIIVTEAAPQHKVGATSDDIDSINLQNVHLANDRPNGFFGSAWLWSIMQSLRGDYQPTHGIQREGFHRYSFIEKNRLSMS